MLHAVLRRVYRTNEMNWTGSWFTLYSPCNATELNWNFSSVQFIPVACYTPLL